MLFINFIAGDNVQKKWKYLRDYFRNEATKIKPIRSGDAGNQDVSPCWPYYKQLLFLKDQIKNRNSTGNLSAKQQIETIEVGEDGEVEDAESVEVEEDRGIVEVEGVGREKELSSVAGETVVEPRVKLDSRVRKRPNERIGEALLNVEKEKLQFLKEKREKKDSKNEDMLFFGSLMPHIQKIPPEMKLLFRNKVSELVQEFAYCHKQRATVLCSSYPTQMSASTSGGSLNN